jgi:predicted DNA-binding protein
MEQRRIYIRVPRDLCQKLKMHCVRMGKTVTHYLTCLISKDLEDQEAHQAHLDRVSEQLLQIKNSVHPAMEMHKEDE